MNHPKNCGGPKKVPKIYISNYCALICSVACISIYESPYVMITFPKDFILTIQKFQNMENVYTVKYIDNAIKEVLKKSV